jgi:hypothetical protein
MMWPGPDVLCFSFVGGCVALKKSTGISRPSESDPVLFSCVSLRGNQQSLVPVLHQWALI